MQQSLGKETEFVTEMEINVSLIRGLITSNIPNVVILKLVVQPLFWLNLQIMIGIKFQLHSPSESADPPQYEHEEIPNADSSQSKRIWPVCVCGSCDSE